MPKEDFRFHHTLRVRWGECDAQGIVFNAQYLNFVEVAQAEYFRNLGVLLYDKQSRKHFDVATVTAKLDFLAPARVDDILRIYMRVSKIGNTSIRVLVEIHRQGPEELLTTGDLVYVTYNSDEGKSRPMPVDVRDLITRFEELGSPSPG